MTAKKQNYSFMDLDLFKNAEILRSQNTQMKIFDWVKAAQLIKEKQPQIAEAGLSGDWDYTGGVIYQDGQPVLDQYTYLGSMWATPTLILDEEEMPCWSYENESQWTSSTKWPEEAIQILTEL